MNEIELDGVFNFRDLGGLPVAGGVTRPGMVFRSDGLHRVPQAERGSVAERGIGVVVDLRSPEEVEDEGRFDHDGIEVRHVPVLQAPREMIGGDSHAADPLRSHFVAMAINAGPQFGAALRELAAAVQAERPVVFHCTAGKDRTGVVAALLLVGLGASTDVVADDFARSAPAMEHLVAWFHANEGQSPPERMAKMGMPSELVTEMLSARASTIEGVLADLVDRYGSIEAYLQHIDAADAVAATGQRWIEPRGE